MSDQVLTRLKNIVSVHNGATPKSDNPEFWDGDIAWATPVDLSTLKSKYLHSTQRKITNLGYHSCNTKLVEPGNIVISNRAPIGLVAINKIPVCTNQGCKVLILNKYKVDVAYLYYYLLSIADDLQNLGTGTTFMEISSETLKNITIPVVPLPRQKDIAEWLDKKTATIDKMIAAKNRTRTHLAELRTAIISELIFGAKGLEDGSNQLYRHLISQQSGTWGLEPNGFNEVKCLRVADFDYDKLTHVEPETIRSIDSNHMATKLLRHGDILIEKSGGGEKAPVGRAIIVNELNGLTSYANFVDRLRFKKTVLPRYALYVLYAMYSGGINTKHIKQNTGIQNLDIKHYLKETVPIPSIQDQLSIIKHAQVRLSKLDAAADLLNKTILQLKEYRTSLISNVITGKVEV